MHVLVHGGAGSDPDAPPSRQQVLEDAAAAGAEEPTPIDAVETAVNALEAYPQFNAGVGSCVQSDGIPRTDAGMMTSDRSVGAACAMPGVEAAVSVARYVLEETPHVLLAGVHAVDLAAGTGVETEADLWTDDTRKRFADASVPDGSIGEQLDWVRGEFGGTTADPTSHRDHDTVGAVAVDGGRVAAATSTGGRWLALAGRVGDVPQVGSGFYASPSGGASATGAGEDIARVTLARRAVQLLEDGADAGTAAELAIEEFEDVTGSDAGVIVADADGDLGSAYNTAAMPTATVRQ